LTEETVETLYLLGQDDRIMVSLATPYAIRHNPQAHAAQKRRVRAFKSEKIPKYSYWSQLPIKAWHDVIGEPTFADAILDRIVHNAYRIELEKQSMRKTIAKMDDETPQI